MREESAREPPPAWPRTGGLIRVTPDMAREAAPESTPSEGRSRFDRRAPAPEEPPPTRETPRVLGKAEPDLVAPPPFLAERSGGAPPTPLRRKPAPAGEPETPAFLRDRATPSHEPDAPDPGAVQVTVTPGTGLS